MNMNLYFDDNELIKLAPNLLLSLLLIK